MPRMLDLFCGRWGWSKAFAARGWECVGVDLDENAGDVLPPGAEFILANILEIGIKSGEICYRSTPLGRFDFICASPPCEKFSVYGLPMWFKDPEYPAEGIDLFNRARMLCWMSETRHIIENVRSAERFIGPAAGHCGPFYLWGDSVPPLLHQGITKGSMLWSAKYRNMKKSQRKREVAEIPPELASCVADYAERLLEQRELGAPGKEKA